jgi:hypothetical protein
MTFKQVLKGFIKIKAANTSLSGVVRSFGQKHVWVMPKKDYKKMALEIAKTFDKITITITPIEVRVEIDIHSSVNLKSNK